MSKNILVVAAHPDDEVLGCGGTIARLGREGHSIHIAILGEGVTSRSADGDHEASLETLKSCCIRASRILGARAPEMFNLPDNRFDTLPLLDIVKKVEDLVVRIRPSIVFTHHASDLNIDHTITNRAVLTATRPLPDHTVPSVYLFEVASSSEWGFQQLGAAFAPNLFYNIDAHLQTKVDALKAYTDEIRDFPHPRSEEAVIAAARRWGSWVGHHAAEPFEIARVVNA